MRRSLHGCNARSFQWQKKISFKLHFLGFFTGGLRETKGTG